MRILLLIFTLCHFSVFAQQKSLTMQVAKGSFFMNNLSGHVYTFWDNKLGCQFLNKPKNKPEFNVGSYDTDLNNFEEIIAPVGEINSKIIDFNFIQTSNKYFWYYGYWDGALKQDILTAQEYDFKTKQFISRPVIEIVNRKLFEERIFPNKPFYFFRNDNENRYSFYTSNDKTKTMVIYQFFPDRSRPIEWSGDYGFTVLDENGQKLWNLDFQMPFIDNLIKIISVNVSNSGDVFIMVKVYENSVKESNSQGLPNYTFQLLKFQKGKPKPIFTPISLENKFIEEIALIEKEPNIFHCHGYYSDTKKTETINGMYYFTIDGNNPGKSTITRKYFDFKDYYNSQSENNLKNTANSELYDSYSIGFLNYISTIDLPDGGNYILGEVAYFSADQGSHSLLTDGTYANFYSDIYVSRFDANHKLLWIKSFPKDQKYYMYYSVNSFNYLQDNYNLHFIYFDNPKNLTRDKSKPPLDYMANLGGALIHTTMDENGEFRSELLEDYKGEGTRLDVNKLLRVNNKSTLIGRVYNPKFKDRALKIWLK